MMIVHQFFRFQFPSTILQYRAWDREVVQNMGNRLFVLVKPSPSDPTQRGWGLLQPAAVVNPPGRRPVRKNRLRKP